MLRAHGIMYVEHKEEKQLTRHQNIYKEKFKVF